MCRLFFLSGILLFEICSAYLHSKQQRKGDIKMKKIKTGKIEHREFGYQEFITHAVERKRSQRAKNGGAKSSRKTEKGTNTWSGVNVFSEAVELGRYGWDAGLEQLKLEEGDLTGVGVEVNPSVSGAFVNIGAYLEGSPENMFQLNERREYSLEEMDIYISLGYNCGTSYEQAMRFCQSIAKIVNKYQSKYNVRIIGRFDNQQHGCRSICDVVIKEIDTRFVLNNVAFAFHPAFFRRLWFSFIEGEEYISTAGYGSSNDDNTYRKQIEKDIEKSKTKSIITPQISATDDGVFDESAIQKINFK